MKKGTKSRIVRLTMILLFVLPGYIWASASTTACPGGRCAGLGSGFYLPSINVLDPAMQTAGRVLLKDTLVGTCSTVSPSGTTTKDFQSFDSSTSVQKSMSAGINTSPQGVSGIAVSGFTLSGTINANYDSKSINSAASNASTLNYLVLDSVVDLDRNSACWSEANLDSKFLGSFEALPINDPKQAADASSWADYINFLRSWGSHIQTKQQLGSRLQIFESEKTTDQVDTKTLETKICASLGLAAGIIPLCGNYNNTQKATASTRDTFEKIYAAGGTRAIRTAIVGKGSGQYTVEDLNAFMNDSGNSDQPVGFGYTPVWELLMDVYRTGCTSSGPESKACQHFQRAVNLQAAFEGFLSYNCILNRTTPADASSTGIFVQGMIALPKNGNGISYYACKQTKSGCNTNNDCSSLKIKKDWAFDVTQCFCQGASCISSTLIPGTDQYRSVVKTTESVITEANSNVGVNASCKDDSTCTCDTAWAGGQQEREIWNQATGSGGSGSFTTNKIAKKPEKLSALVATPLAGNAADLKETFKVTVTIKHPNATTNAQKNRQFNANHNHIAELLVSSADGGNTIECPGKCSGEFNKGSTVKIYARNTVADKFVRWSLDTCLNNSGVGSTCEISDLGSDIILDAYFNFK